MQNLLLPRKLSMKGFGKAFLSRTPLEDTYLATNRAIQMVRGEKKVMIDQKIDNQDC